MLVVASSRQTLICIILITHVGCTCAFACSIYMSPYIPFSLYLPYVRMSLPLCIKRGRNECMNLSLCPLLCVCVCWKHWDKLWPLPESAVCAARVTLVVQPHKLAKIQKASRGDYNSSEQCGNLKLYRRERRKFTDFEGNIGEEARYRQVVSIFAYFNPSTLIKTEEMH